MRIYFITGIDTDIGKTFATGLMARWLRHRNVNAITQKPVQTGNVNESEDIARHREIMGVAAFPEDAERLTCPIIYRFPASPHLAAELEHSRIDPAKISAATDELARRYETVLVEGAGGLMVPLTPELLTIDYIASRRYPVILVTSGRLGSLNHTLMSLELLKSRRITVAGVVYNLYPPADPVITADSARYIRRALRDCGCPDALTEIPAWRPGAEEPDFTPIFFPEKGALK